MNKIFFISKNFSLKEANKIAISKINDEYYYMERIPKTTLKYHMVGGINIAFFQKENWIYEFGNVRPCPMPIYKIFKGGKRIQDLV